MKFAILLFGIALANNAHAAECSYSINSADVEVKWTAYKTPKKLGVSGKFKKLGLSGKKEGESLSKILSGTKFNIDPTSIASGDKTRDEKIAKFFFSNLEGKNLTGSIVEMGKGVVVLDLKMNGVSKKVPLAYRIKRNKFLADGYLDILDFSMNNSLKAINEACAALHEGKTWSDVKVALEFSFKKDCKKK